MKKVSNTGFGEDVSIDIYISALDRLFDLIRLTYGHCSEIGAAHKLIVTLMSQTSQMGRRDRVCGKNNQVPNFISNFYAAGVDGYESSALTCFDDT